MPISPHSTTSDRHVYDQWKDIVEDWNRLTPVERRIGAAICRIEGHTWLPLPGDHQKMICRRCCKYRYDD